MFDGMLWFSASRRDPRVVDLYSRHYSAVKNNKTVSDWLAYGITAPGESIVLLTSDSLALFVWMKQKYVDNGQDGVNCAVFRNEGEIKSSELILAAEKIAWRRWPGERLYTYVDPKSISSANPGYCFLIAGWTRIKETTSRGLRILEKLYEHR